MSGYNKYREYGNAVDDYKAKCALAEKLGDVSLRQWCVEQMGVGTNGTELGFAKVDKLFEYIKNRTMTDAK